MAENNGKENDNGTGESSSEVILYNGTSNIEHDLLIEKINHISSFIRVLKARVLFMFSALAGQQRRFQSITGDTSISEYKATLEEYLSKVEKLELHTAVFNSAIQSVEMGEYFNKSKEAIIKVVNENSPADEKHILDNFVEIVETADSIIQSTAEQKELHSKVTNYKQHYIQKLEHHHLLREERLAILNAQNDAPDENNIVKLETILQKKVDNLNIMRGIILTVLSSPFMNIDFTEHPELLEISKRRRKRFTIMNL